MISESEHIINNIKNSLDRILYLQKNLKPDVMSGEPPKTDGAQRITDLTYSISGINYELDTISKNLK